MQKFQILLLLIILILPSNAWAKLKIGVLELRPGVEMSQSTVTGISDMFVSELINTRTFTIIERTQVNKLISELGFSKGRALSKSQIATLGKRLKVDALVIGTINFQTRDKNTAKNINYGEYNIDIRLVDVNDGTIIASAGDSQRQGQTTRELIKTIVRQFIASYDDYAASEVAARQVPSQPITLLGYLSVYPSDLGSFSVSPANAINNLNRQAIYGINNWRLPTVEELDIIRSHSAEIGLKPRATYASSSSRFSSANPMNVRLVSSEVVKKVNIDEKTDIEIYPRTQDLGELPLFKSSVETSVNVQNNSPKAVSITKITCASSNVIIGSYNSYVASASEVNIPITIKAKGSPGTSATRKIFISLSNGRTLTAIITYTLM